MIQFRPLDCNQETIPGSDHPLKSTPINNIIDGLSPEAPGSIRTPKREVADHESNSVLKLVQKLPSADIPRDVQIRELADRLIRKYNPGREPETYQSGRAAGILQTGTDFSYFAQVELGSKNDPLLMLLDTGAGTSWVMGPDCTSTACKSRASFGAADSSTFKAVDMDLSIAYGSGHVTGTYATDTIKFAGMSFPYTLGIANSTSDQFNAFPFSGILGLSQQTGPVPNFLETVVSSKSLKANVFGMDLNRASDGPNTGEINFGAPDTSRYSGSLSYTNVAKNGPHHWALPLDNTTIRGQFLVLQTTSMSFTFSGVTYNVSSEDWVGPSVDGVCTSNIYGVSVVDKNSWLIGDTLFKNIYALFDVDQNRIGLAPKKAVTSSATSTSFCTGISKLDPTNTLSAGFGFAMATSDLVSNTFSPGSATQTGTASNSLLPGTSTTLSTQSSGTAVSDSASTSASSTHASGGDQIRSYSSPMYLLVAFATALLF
ncbi:hypothetical protein EYC84_005803 [Monilinia fructicola]|uniref:Peptidase A1 domain-containing protein n=1 Tax=Monilinia fructicola TaxID=38448 RepID=A0A5M9K0L5_MONFR|nr:hypothetical protein EYC84_005803 [Monilinia fructicola]